MSIGTAQVFLGFWSKPGIVVETSGMERMPSWMRRSKNAEAISLAQALVLASLKHRRDRWLAHLDRKTIRDPATFAENAKLTLKELEGIFAGAAEILNDMAVLHGVPGFLIDGSEYDDFSFTLQLINKGVQSKANEVEQRFGPCPGQAGSF
jgi:hypothetical protein